MHEHYLAQPHREEGKSAAELIQSYRERRRLHRSFFQLGNAIPRAKQKSQLVLLEQEKNFDEKIEEIRGDVQRRMLADASNGNWLAVGRRGPDAERELIPPRNWAFLRMDLENEALLGDEVSFRDVRCAIANEISGDDPIHNLLQAAQRRPLVTSPPTPPSVPEDLGRNDGPGRPSYFHLIEQEFVRRCAANEIEPSQVRQAVELAEWYRTTYPNKQPYTAKTIKNRLGSRYRAAMSPRAQKRPKL